MTIHAVLEVMAGTSGKTWEFKIWKFLSEWNLGTSPAVEKETRSRGHLAWPSPYSVRFKPEEGTPPPEDTWWCTTEELLDGPEAELSASARPFFALLASLAALRGMEVRSRVLFWRTTG